MFETVGVIYSRAFSGGVILKYIPSGEDCKFPIATIEGEVLNYKGSSWEIIKININSRFLCVRGASHKDWPVSIENLYDIKHK